MAKVTSGGSYYSIKDNSQVASAFGDAIGGILSVVAQNVLLTISVPEEARELGAEIVAVHHDRKTEISEGVFQVDVGDLYAEETRDVLFEVSLASPKTILEGAAPGIDHAYVELSYMDTIKHDFVGPLSCAAAIERPNNDDLGWPEPHVAVQWMRIRTAKVISQAEDLAKRGELDKATEEITNWMDAFQKERFEIGSRDPLLEQLLADLMDCLEMLKGTEYNAYVENELGVRMQVRCLFHVESNCYSESVYSHNELAPQAHFSQRCSEPLGKKSVYRTAQKSFRAQAFDQRV